MGFKTSCSDKKADRLILEGEALDANPLSLPIHQPVTI